MRVQVMMKTFQYNPQHLFLKIVINSRLLTEDADYIMQVGRLLLGQLQPHHPGRTVEQKAVAGHLIVMSVDAVEITVETKVRNSPATSLMVR